MSLELKGSRALVTGGLGFLGSNLAIKLLELDVDVTILDSLVPEHGARWQNLSGFRDRLNVNVSDMRDRNSLNALVQAQDFIFHLAGQVSHGDSMRDPHGDLGVNCISTMNLVEACRHHNAEARLIYTSTRQVYGRPNQLPVKEDHPTVPVDVNGINKLAAEFYHLLYHTTYGIRSSVLRLTNSYGPRQQIRNDRQGFIGIMIRQALRGEKIRVFGTGRQLRDFNYVDDVSQALILAAEHEACYGRIWNLGAPHNYSLLDFVRLLGEICSIEYEIVPFPKERGAVDIGDYYGDYSRFTAATGWEAKVDLQEGLQRTIDWYRDQGEDYWA
jgi:UDP-glucose 4-epimerase